MGAFFGDWSGPGQTVVDPRKTIRLTWFYYRGENPDQDDLLQYFKVYWKPYNVKGWTDPAVKSTIITNTEATYFDLPPNSWPLNSAGSWKVEAWVIDKDYNPDTPPGDGVPTNVPFVAYDTMKVVDTSGYVLGRSSLLPGIDAGGGVTQGHVDQNFFIYDLVPSDPGEYEVRFRAANGFLWSLYSSPVPLIQYDSRRWVKKSTGRWWCVPDWKKSGSVMTRIKK